MRLAQTQVWPMLRNLDWIAPSTAAATWASSKTMNGALPPSSSPTFFTAPAALRQFPERERGQRRLRRGLGAHRAADRERRRDLAGDHGGGKVPWRDRRHDADRLPDHDDARIGAEGRIDLAIDALGLLAEEFDV